MCAWETHLGTFFNWVWIVYLYEILKKIHVWILLCAFIHFLKPRRPSSTLGEHWAPSSGLKPSWSIFKKLLLFKKSKLSYTGDFELKQYHQKFFPPCSNMWLKEVEGSSVSDCQEHGGTLGSNGLEPDGTGQQESGLVDLRCCLRRRRKEEVEEQEEQEEQKEQISMATAI